MGTSDFLPIFRDWGPTGLVVVLIVLGWLIPRRTHERELRDKDHQIKTWEEAWRASDARADLLTEQNTKLLVGVETTVAIVTALAQRAADPPRAAKEPL